ncbi:cytochrome P450 [Parvularcula sp. IMCC14364]|uniref:cytochrome P450 n=1 Tax=Parvularcula sp. IMCC14364 TaxID=3067902 RepID=UPI0027420604|nr:cytochrome P450 [Parvularcula sp. IMCC14364]
MSATTPQAAFEPPTVNRRQDAAGFLTVYRDTLRNPIEMWSEYFFHNRTYTLKAGGRTFMQVMDPVYAKQILLSDADCFKKSYIQDRLLKPAVGEGLLTTEGAVWRQQRKAVTPAFRHEALIKMVPTMQKAASDTAQRISSSIDQAHEECHLDIHEQMVQATYDIIEATLLSGESTNPDYSQRQVADDIAKYLQTVGKFNLLDLFDAPDWVPRALANPGIAEGKKAVARMRAFAAEQIRNRQQQDHPGEDLLGLMISARDPETGNGLKDAELLDNLMTFIGAGHETTAVALTWTISILSQMPEWQDRLYDEVKEVAGDTPIAANHLPDLDLHERVIMETMRLYPPVCLIPRSVCAPVTVGGNNLKPGDHVSIAVYPMQRHAFLWDNPNAFDPARFTEDQVKARDRFVYLPFGAGPRICIGLKFAMMEAVTILATLTRQFHFRHDDRHEIVPQMNVTLRPKDGMPVFVKQR